MRRGALRLEGIAALPWLAAGVLWFGLIVPMRAEQETLLGEQSRIRRDRVETDRSARETRVLGARAAAALGSACRASTDPAMLRQRAVAATAGLDLSPFTLSVTGGPAGGTLIETTGPRSDVQELLRRLGDPARGGFLRSVDDPPDRFQVERFRGHGSCRRGPKRPAPSDPSVRPLRRYRTR